MKISSKCIAADKKSSQLILTFATTFPHTYICVWLRNSDTQETYLLCSVGKQFRAYSEKKGYWAKFWDRVKKFSKMLFSEELTELRTEMLFSDKEISAKTADEKLRKRAKTRSWVLADDPDNIEKSYQEMLKFFAGLIPAHQIIPCRSICTSKEDPSKWVLRRDAIASKKITIQEKQLDSIKHELLSNTKSRTCLHTAMKMCSHLLGVEESTLHVNPSSLRRPFEQSIVIDENGKIIKGDLCPLSLPHKRIQKGTTDKIYNLLLEIYKRLVELCGKNNDAMAMRKYTTLKTVYEEAIEMYKSNSEDKKVTSHIIQHYCENSSCYDKHRSISGCMFGFFGYKTNTQKLFLRLQKEVIGKHDMKPIEPAITTAPAQRAPVSAA